MSSRDKGMIAFAIVAIVLAGVFIYRTYASQQPQATKTLYGMSGQAPKLQALKAMKEQQAGQNTSGTPVTNATGGQ